MGLESGGSVVSTRRPGRLVEAVRLALNGPDGPTGTFSDEDGPVPW